MSEDGCAHVATSVAASSAPASSAFDVAGAAETIRNIPSIFGGDREEIKLWTNGEHAVGLNQVVDERRARGRAEATPHDHYEL